MHPREHTLSPHQRRRTDAELRNERRSTDAILAECSTIIRAHRTEDMAAALIRLNAESPAGATRQSLVADGFTQTEIDLYFEGAQALANARFVRDVDSERDQVEPPHLTRARMAVAIGELLPSRQFIVTELACRGFTKNQMDAYLRGAIDEAGRAFTGIAQRRVNA